MSEAVLDELDFATNPSASRWLEASLEDAGARLDRALGDALRAAGSSGVAFDVPDPNLPAAERELLAALTPFSARAAPLSFASSDADARADTAPDPAEEAQIMSWLERLYDSLTTLARVETQVAGRRVASTRVGLVGDMLCSIDASASAEQLRRHASELDQTLRARQARLRVVLSIFEATAKITVALRMANPLLALRAGWRFIRDVMREWQASTT